MNHVPRELQVVARAADHPALAGVQLPDAAEIGVLPPRSVRVVHIGGDKPFPIRPFPERERELAGIRLAALLCVTADDVTNGAVDSECDSSKRKRASSGVIFGYRRATPRSKRGRR